MSSRSLVFVSANRRKFQFYQQCLRYLKSDLRLVQQDFDPRELQNTQEIEVLEGKVEQVLKRFKPPFFIDDEGFYIDTFKSFPGTLAPFVIDGLGWEELVCLASPQRKVILFCNVAFVDSAGEIHVFSHRSQGLLVQNQNIELGKGSIDDYFVPDGQKLTLTQISSIPELQNLFPRYRVAQDMVKSKCFVQEFCRVRTAALTG